MMLPRILAFIVCLQIAILLVNGVGGLLPGGHQQSSASVVVDASAFGRMNPSNSSVDSAPIGSYIDIAGAKLNLGSLGVMVNGLAMLLNVFNTIGPLLTSFGVDPGTANLLVAAMIPLGAGDLFMAWRGIAWYGRAAE